MEIAVFDIGGTSMKYGIMSRGGRLSNENSVPTEAARGGASIIERVIQLAGEMQDEFGIEGVAISSAGQINPGTGEVVHATDAIPGYAGIDIQDTVSSRVGLPTTAENDVNCTALGEKWQGSAIQEEDFLCVTIGTGIGGAIFLNGELYRGSTFAAGEWGHMTLYPGGRRFLCGFEGCFEEYASSRALERRVAGQFGGIGLETFFERVKQGGAAEAAIFDGWLDDLCLGLKSLTHALNPSLILIGGGITAQGDFLENAISRRLSGMIMANHKKPLTVKLAKNRNQANLYGAALHFWQTYESR